MEKKEKEEGIVFEKESMFGKKKEGTGRREKFKEGRGEQGVGWTVEASMVEQATKK